MGKKITVTITQYANNLKKNTTFKHFKPCG